MANKTIPNLPDYGSQDTDKIKKDLLEITKNDGTYASPSYPTGASRKITLEEFKTALAIETSLIKDIVFKYDVDTVLEIGKINWINSTLDRSLTIPTANVGNLGKILIVNNRSIYTVTIYGSTGNLEVLKGVDSIAGFVCVTDGSGYGWETFTYYNKGEFDLKEDLITKNALSTPLVWTSANGVASFQPMPVLGDLTYYLTNTASDVATYYKQTTTPQVALTSLPFASVTNGQLLATFISEPNNPNRLSIPDGQYLNHLHLGKTGGTKDLQVRAEIWETTSAGVDIVKLADLGPSTILVGSGSTEYIIGYNTVEKTLSAVTSRIATKVYAVVSGGGSAPSISIFQGDGSDSRSNLPAPVVDATNYVPYEGMLKDLTTGSKDIIYSNATVSTPTFFDATKKLITTTAQLWGTWVQTWSNKATPVDADTIGFHDSASTFVGVKSTLLNLWTAYLLPKVQALGYISGSGTNGTLPKFTGSGTLGNSTITEDSNSVTLGKTFIVGANGLKWSASAITSALPTLPSIATWAPFTTDSGRRVGLYSNVSTYYTTILSNDESTVWFNNTTSGSYLRYPDATLIGTPPGALCASSAYSGNSCVLRITGYRSVSSTDYFIAWAYLSGSSVTSLYFEKDPNNTTTLNIAIDSAKIKVTGSSDIRCTIEPIINYNALGLDTHHVKYYFGTDGQLLQWKGTSGIQVGTGTKSASSILQSDSTTQGFLPPRMTNAQRTAIAGGTPAVGLMVYCTDATEGLYIYKSTGWTFII